jgi:rRNA maturation endonuclease Nob1
VERKIKKTSSFARGNCLAKHRIRIISLVHEGEGKRAHKRVCAWCYKVIQEGRGPVTHGICPECEEREMSRYLEETNPRPGVSGRSP